MIPHASAHRSSGDLIADRRFTYAQEAAAQGDFSAATDLLVQTSELVPHWAPVWLELGLMYEKLRRLDEAHVALSRAAAADPSDELGAGLHLARLGLAPRPATASAAYVRGLFDQYAARFDTHLTEALAYRAPALLADAVRRLHPAAHFASVLDLGCGTGLGGHVFREVADHLVGVDLSPRMVAVAREKAIYDRLEVADILDFMRGEPSMGFDLLVAADVLVYVGDLALVFAAAFPLLPSRGLFAFTLQRGAADCVLGADLRFAHAPSYVRDTAEAAGFSLRLSDPISSRRDGGEDVPGLLVILELP